MMADHLAPPHEDDAIEIALGHLLRIGVLLAAFIVLVGAIVYLVVRHHGATTADATFAGDPQDLRPSAGS